MNIDSPRSSLRKQTVLLPQWIRVAAEAAEAGEHTDRIHFTIDEVAMVNPAEIFPKGIGRTPYTIRRRTEETHDIVVVDIVPTADGEVPVFKPGQFVMVTILRDGKAWQRKAYSIASSPTDRDHLQIGFKVHGEFTIAFAKLREGDPIEIDGPYGLFTFDEQAVPSADFFAGGIGITPFMSMLRYAAAKQLTNDLTLLYCNKTAADIAYFEELQALATKHDRIKVIFSVDKIDDPAWAGERGIVSREMIERSCRTFQGKTFYLCGPKPFMNATEQHLLGCGVQRQQICQEIF